MLMHTANYLRIVGWEHDAIKRAEKSEAREKAIEAAREVYEGIPIQQSTINKPPKMKNSTNTDVTYGDA